MLVSLAGRIALSAFYLKRGDFDLAQKEIELAKKIQPNHQLIALIQADIYLATNQFDSAQETILVRQRITPENRALSYKLAEIYIRQGNFVAAERLANKFIQINNRDAQAWFIRQQAANLDIKNPLRTVNVLRYRAEVEYWKGAEENAIRSLIHAQRLAKENNSMSAVINQRLRMMQDERQQKL